MLDMKFIRSHLDEVREGARRKRFEVDFDRLLELDDERRTILGEQESLKHQQKIAGKNIANPTSLILSAAMMLSWLGERRGVAALKAAGKAIAEAVDTVINDPAKRTRDLGGTVNTDAFGKFVAEEIAGKAVAA